MASKPKVFGEPAVLALLRQAIEESGGLRAWCRRTGVDPAIASRVTNGIAKPTPHVLAALGLRRVTAYTFVSQEPR